MGANVRVTIKDIAKMCGVSITTVSRTINGRAQGVGAETRQRILDAVEQSGYQPNQIARSMITKKTNTMALVIPDVCNPFFAELARGVGDACAEAGYHLFLCNTDSSAQQEVGQVQFLRERLVDGIILTTQNAVEENDFIRDFIAQDYPFVLVERYVKGVECPLQVTLDNRGGIELLVDHLVEQGHRRIAYVNGPQQAVNAALRYEGYRRALERHHLPFDAALVAEGDYKMQTGYDATKQLLEQQKERFTALLLANDLMAIGACNAIADMGLSVPQDLSVVGFDNLPLTGMVQPRVTTAGVSINQLGHTAAELLLQRLAGRKEERHIFLPCELVPRNSVQPLP